MATKISDVETLPLLVERLEKFGERPAVIRFTRGGRETWSYTRTGQEAGLLAAGLVEAGVRAGEKIAVIAEPSPEWVVAALAILRAGGVLVPVDAQISDRDLQRVLADSGLRRLFATDRIARRIDRLNQEGKLDIFLLDEPSEEEMEAEPVGRLNWRTLLADHPSPVGKSGNLLPSPGRDDPAVLFYTSGTTGPPKGVPLSHRNILFQLQAVEKTGLVMGEDRMLLPLPLHHVYPLVIGLLIPLALGVPVILPHALTGDGIVRALSEGEATMILGVPRLYRALFEGIRAKAGAAGSNGGKLFSAALALARMANRYGVPLGKLLFRPVRRKIGPRVRLLASGGSPLDPVLAGNLEALGWPIAVGYGLTETSPLLTIKLPGEGSFASVGRVIEGVEIKVDPSGLPDGEREGGKIDRERGEVLARGPSVFGGYLHLPEKTKEAFSEDWFRTGDLGYIDENGFLHLGGRASSMIVLEGGENINPEELEEAYGDCEEVAEIGILEDNGKLAALVLPSRVVLRRRDRGEIQKLVGEALRRCSAGMPSYKRLSHIEIARQPLPTTRLGKIQRHHLKRRYAAAKAGEDDEKRKTGPVSLDELSSQDRILLDEPSAKKVWDLLSQRYPNRRLSPDANLELDLGIDSLEWVELSLSAGQRTGVSINEETIGRVETVRDLLEAVAGIGAEEAGEERRPIENPEAVLSESDRRWAEPRGPLLMGLGTVLFGLLRALVGLRCRIEAVGLENLPGKGPVLLTPNHVSFFDAPALGLALGLDRARGCFWAGRAEILFRNFFWRGLSRLCQAVPIDPRRGPLSSLAVGALVLKRDRPLVWFPEGAISRDGELHEFQPGIGLIIHHYQPVIIPIYLEGTRDVMPLGRTIPRSGRITVHFGPPVDGRQLNATAERGQEGYVHERIARALRESVKRLEESVKEEERAHGKAA